MSKSRRGSERHRDFAKSLDGIDLRVEAIKVELQKIPPLVVVVDGMVPQVKNLMEFRARMAAIILVSSIVIGGAFSFIWSGSNISGQISNRPSAASLVGRRAR